MGWAGEVLILREPQVLRVLCPTLLKGLAANSLGFLPRRRRHPPVRVFVCEQAEPGGLGAGRAGPGNPNMSERRGGSTRQEDSVAGSAPGPGPVLVAETFRLPLGLGSPRVLQAQEVLGFTHSAPRHTHIRARARTYQEPRALLTRGLCWLCLLRRAASSPPTRVAGPGRERGEASSSPGVSAPRHCALPAPPRPDPPNSQPGRACPRQASRSGSSRARPPLSTRGLSPGAREGSGTPARPPPPASLLRHRGSLGPGPAPPRSRRARRGRAGLVRVGSRGIWV